MMTLVLGLALLYQSAYEALHARSTLRYLGYLLMVLLVGLILNTEAALLALRSLF